MTVIAPVLVATITGATPKPQGTLVRAPGTLRGLRLPDTTLDYRAHVVAELARHWRPRLPLDRPVDVDVMFAFPRPAAHYHPANTRRPTRTLRDDAPGWPVTLHTGDVDKLQRLVGDALKLACVLADDRLIVGWRAVKLFADSANGWTAVRIYDAQQLRNAHLP